MYEVSEEGRMGMGDVSMKQLIKQIDKRFKHNMVTTPILIMGPVGIGKTEAIMGYAAENGLGYKEIRLANYQETDLVGMPKIIEKDRRTIKRDYTTEEIAAGKNLTVQWVQQSILPDENSYDFKEKGILFIDEITNCSAAVQAAAWQLMDASRSVGSYHLPDGWLVIAAGNGPEDGGNFTSMSSALLGRCEAYRIAPDFNSWRSWAISKNIHFSIVAFLNMYKDMLWGGGVDIDGITSGTKFPMPRMWAAASKSLDISEKEEGKALTYEDAYFAVQGFVGPKAASSFAGFYVLREQLIDIDDVVEGRIKLDGDALRGMRREAFYMQSEMLVQRLVEAVKLNVEGNDKDGLRMAMNCMKFIMAAANYNLDIGKTIIEEIADSKMGSAWFRFNLTNMQYIARECPEWDTFFTKHRALFPNNL